MNKTVGIVVAVLVALGAGWYLFSNYLVSKLDGTGGVTAPSSSKTSYESADLGLRFEYPNTYVTNTIPQGNAEREWHVIVLLPEGYVPPEGGEGPPTISVQVISNPEGTELEQWIKGDARSNWKLAADDAALEPVMIGGVEGLAYRHSGLYETNAVAVAREGKIYLFSVGWLTPEDEAVRDFETLLKTVQFI